MWEFFTHLFDTSDFPPRWYCGNWSSGLGWLHIVSDIATGAAYIAIPTVLGYFILRRRDLPFPRVFLLFSAFIFTCGTMHLVEAVIFWEPVYRFLGLLKFSTAIVSWAAALALIPIAPRALALRSPAVLEKEVQERRRAETRFRQLLDTAPDATIIVDADGTIVMVNRQTEHVLGYTRDELTGQKVEVLIPERFRPQHPALRREYMAHPRARPMGAGLDLYARRKDGTEFPVEISLGPLETQEGLLISAAIRDITARQQAEAKLQHYADELERSNMELQQFAYIASHDLQEPLRAVSGFCELLQRRYRGQMDAQADQWIDFVVDGAKRMQSLVQDLLAYSRVESRAHPFAPVDVNEALAQAKVNLQPTIRETQAEVTSDPLPSVTGDASQLVQLFQNLLGNAIKFRGSELPRIHVSAERTEDAWTFSVRDNGIGIEPEYQERIFELFKRLHRRDEYPGTGIGLAICRRVVHRHGGRIWVESEAGQGSTFRFTIPLEEHSPS